MQMLDVVAAVLAALISALQSISTLVLRPARQADFQLIS